MDKGKERERERERERQEGAWRSRTQNGPEGGGAHLHTLNFKVFEAIVGLWAGQMLVSCPNTDVKPEGGGGRGGGAADTPGQSLATDGQSHLQKPYN